MQHAEIISINIWSIVISLANLVILFLILKKFLYKRVKKALAKRQETLENQYSQAEADRAAAAEERAHWEQKMETAEEEADRIIKEASGDADNRSRRIVAEARDKADDIVRQAELEAERELKKAEAEVKQEIIDVSAVLAGKMLSREVDPRDHKEMIDSFIDSIGEDNE